MSQMTPAQARVIDPVLTTAAQGYKNAEMVAGYLFPQVPVGQRGGKIVSFGKEDFLLQNTARAPGTATKRIQYGHAGLPYTLESHSLEGLVPVENMQEAAAVPGIDLGIAAVSRTQGTVALRLEYQAASIATNPANYGASNKITLSGTSQWSDFTSGVSDPVKDVGNAKEAIRKATGKRPNTLLMGASVFEILKQHPKIIDRLKYTGRDVATEEIMASLFGVKRVVVGDAIYSDTAGNTFDVWGKVVVLAFTEVSELKDGGLPSYGYTYRLNGYPVVEEPYADRNAKSWIYPVTDEVVPVLAAPTAGYLISAVIA